MAKTTITPKAIQQALITDEDLSASIASLVPVSSKITDAAATFIDKAYAQTNSDKKIFSSTELDMIDEAIKIAQQVVKEGAAINRLLRNPREATEVIKELKEGIK